MGIVYRARHPELGPRALKVVRPDLLGTDGKALRRLRAEAQTLAHLGHPSIVPVHEFGELPDGSNYYLVMELLEGGDLGDRLRRAPAPSLDEVLALLRQLGDALAFVHARGVVHRDLKPSNVLYAPDGRIKLGDFGVARDRALEASSTVGFVGALAYAAPEQLGGGAIGPATDRFALGLLGYDLVLGRPAHDDAATRAAALRRLCAALDAGARPPELAHHGDDRRLRPLLALLARLTEPDPARRPTALDLPT
jgi:serine/threonine-protein kinase